MIEQSWVAVRRPRALARLRAVLLASGAALCAGSLFAPACAGATEAASAAASETTLGEVIVTAQHRAENVQHTPIAISVYDSQALKVAGITSIQDLSTIAPNVNFTVTEGQPILTVRGISSRDTNETGNPAVTVNTDGFYLNRAYFLNAAFYDIERVEVLRGPQGTLNGRNSVGGALNIVTARPVNRFDAYTSVQYGNYNDLEVQAMVNLPISDQVQVRASALSESRDGYRNNGSGIRGDAADNKSARLQLAFAPTPDLHALITAQYTTQGGAGDVMQFIPFVYKANGALDHDLPPGINSKRFPLKTEPYLDLTSKQIRYEVSYDVAGVELKALGGYDKTDYHHAVDQSTAVSNPPAFAFQVNQYPDTYNLEFRATSKTSGPFQWQAGVFLFGEKSHLLAANAAPLPTGGFDHYFGFVYSTKAWSRAAYSQASYQLTDKLKLTGGLRYTKDYVSESGYFGNLTANIPFTAPQYGKAESHKITYHAALDYDLTPANLVYAKFDTGYKSGAFNLGGSTYGPETVKAYEVGSKNRFLDNSLQLNVAAFYNDYSNQQVNSYTTLASGQPVALTLNAGSSRIYGLEADVIYKVGAIGTLNLNVNYLHARYTDFLAVPSASDPVPPPNVLPNGNVQLKGNRPPQSPTWSASIGFEHDWHVFEGTLTGRIQSKLQSGSYFSFYNFPSTKQDAYAMTDAFLTYKPADGNWKVTGYVRNLANAEVFADAEENQYAAAYGFAFYPPRTYGVRLEYAWQ